MLILMRKKGQSIIINNNIRATVVDECKSIVEMEIKKAGESAFTVFLGIRDSVRINKNVIIRISDAFYGQVKVAIEAPRSIPVNREEIQKKIEAEQAIA